MKKTRGSLVFALLAAIFFGTMVLFRLGINAYYSVEYDGYRISPLDVASWLTMLAVTVTLACRTRIGVIAAMGAHAMVEVAWAITATEYEGPVYIFVIAACLFTIVLLILSLAKKRAASFLWFIPAVVVFMGILIYWIRWNMFSYLRGTWYYILLFHIPQILGFLFAGLWIRTVAPAPKAASVPAPGGSPAPVPGYAPPAAGGKNDPRGAGAPAPAPAGAPPAGLRFCGKCGGKIAPDMAFCAYCGAPVRAPEPDTADWVSPIGGPN